ncbi:MAG: hypothetical protein ACKVVT_14580 [Dehalococcoidia bacterium]
MRILRLTNSDDLQGHIPPEQRSAWLSATAMEAEFREPVDVVSKVLWPNDRMPAAVKRWVSEVEPDLVFVRVASYWVTYESVPLRLRRRLGRVGQGLADAGKATARMSWLSQRGFYHFGRSWLLRAIGGDPEFTVDEVVERLETAFRQILLDESIVLVVRGPLTPFNTSGTRAGAARAERRMRQLDERVRQLCAALRVPYVSVSGREDPTDRSVRLGDRVHRNAAGHARVAEWETEALMGAWSQATGRVPAAEPARTP